MRTPDPDNVDRARLHQWNVTLERRLPFDLVASVGYVGTQTNGGYAYVNINAADPGTRQGRAAVFRAGRQRGHPEWVAGRPATITPCRGRQPALQAGPDAQGRLHVEKAMNMTDEDGWAGLMWNPPSQCPRNYARAGYDRPHVLQMGFVYELPLRMRESVLLASRQGLAGQRIFSAYSGTPFNMAATTRSCSRQAPAPSPPTRTATSRSSTIRAAT